MDNYGDAIEKARDTVVKMRYLESIDNMIYCDRWYTCPKDEFDYENEVNRYLSELRHEQLANDRVRGLAEYFRSLPVTRYGNDLERGTARFLMEKYEESQKLSAELQAQLNQAAAQGQRAWEQCFAADNFKAYIPFLRNQFEVMRKAAHAIDPNEHPYQVLVNRFDKEICLEEINQVFQQLKGTVQEILKQSESAWKSVDTSVLNCSADQKTIEQLTRKVQDFLQFDWNRGVMYEAHHPVCSCVGPRDSRPSTNYSHLFYAMLSASHESGHGIYSYSSSDAVARAGLWGGIDGAMHESQAKFFENMIYRTPEFWSAFWPEVQKELPEYRNISPDTIAFALNKPERGLNRIHADELTVSLHVIIRYELERDYFEGKLKLEDMEEAWNAKYWEYLGVTPPTRREGILQDVHWGSGCVGYFQGYTLGCIYTSQFRYKLEQDVPDAYQKLAKGDINGILGWLTDHVYQYGQMYTAREMLQKATGEDMNLTYYTEYLKDKFLKKAPGIRSKL